GRPWPAPPPRPAGEDALQPPLIPAVPGSLLLPVDCSYAGMALGGGRPPGVRDGPGLGGLVRRKRPWGGSGRTHEAPLRGPHPVRRFRNATNEELYSVL